MQNIDTIIWAGIAFLAGYIIGGTMTALYIAAQREEDNHHDF